MVALLLAAALASLPDSSGIEAGVGGLLYGHGSTDLRQEDHALSAYSWRTRLRLRASWKTLSAVAEPSLSRGWSRSGPGDSLMAGMDMLLLEARLPGTPWVGGELFHGCRRPYLPSIGQPYFDLTATDGDSLDGMSLTAGGFLGFSGSWSLYSPHAGDTVDYAAVRAPWVGFGTARAYRLARRGPDGESRTAEVLEGWLSLRRISPWVSLLRVREEDDAWAVRGQLRGLELRPSLDLRLRLTPEVHLAGAGLASGTGGLRPGQRVAAALVSLSSVERAVSVWGYGRVDIEGIVEDSVGVGAWMLSEAGLEYAAGAGLAEEGDAAVELDVDLRRPEAGAGAGVRVVGDSLRVAGRAGYTPRPDVHATMELSGSPTGALDPAGTISVRFAAAGIAGGLGLGWEDGEASVGVDLTAEVPR